jgi:hypothetical protein
MHVFIGEPMAMGQSRRDPISKYQLQINRRPEWLKKCVGKIHSPF